MKRFLLPLALVFVGVAISFILRAVVPSGSGFTVTGPTQTRYIADNVVCFWGVLALTVILGAYFFVRQVRR